MDAIKELKKLDNNQLRMFAQRNGFCFYSLIEVLNGSLKINQHHLKRIQYAYRTFTGQ